MSNFSENQAYIEFNDTVELVQNVILQLSWNLMFQYPLFKDSLQSSTFTLDSIKLCVRNAHISDACVLVRKFRDDLMQYLFIVSTLYKIQEFDAEEMSKYFSFDITSDENIMSSLENILNYYQSKSHKTKEEIAIMCWFNNELENNNRINLRKEYFDAQCYIKYLRKDSYINELFKKYLSDIWNDMNRVLNNYVHTNGKAYILKNIPCYVYSTYDEDIKKVEKLIVDITSIFLSVCIIINPRCIVSDEYINDLEAGLTPPEGSQYGVDEIIQCFIDKHLSKLRKGLKEFLFKCDCYGMKIM